LLTRTCLAHILEPKQGSGNYPEPNGAFKFSTESVAKIMAECLLKKVA